MVQTAKLRLGSPAENGDYDGIGFSGEFSVGHGAIITDVGDSIRMILCPARSILSFLCARGNAGGVCYGVGADALSDVVGSDEEFGLIPCVLIPSGLSDQPLSSLHEEVRSTPAPMTMIPTNRLRWAFIGANSLACRWNSPSSDCSSGNCAF